MCEVGWFIYEDVSDGAKGRQKYEREGEKNMKYDRRSHDDSAFEKEMFVSAGEDPFCSTHKSNQRYIM